MKRSIQGPAFGLAFAAVALIVNPAKADGPAEEVGSAAEVVAPSASPQPGSAQLGAVQVRGQALQDYGADQSVSAGKMPMDIMETPQSVQVIPRQLIEDFRPVFLDDVLRSVSGINQTNTFGNTSDGVTVRGFQPNNYFRNGVRTLNSRNLTPSTERIEVLKGPSSLLYGDIEPGGLINVITKRPRFDSEFLSVDHQWSNRGGQRTGIDAGTPLMDGPNGKLAGRIVAEYDGSDYWRNFGNYSNTFIAPSLSYREDDLRVSATYEYIDNDGPFDRGTVVVGDRIAPIPQTRRLGESFEKLTQTLHVGELSAEYDIRPSTTLRLTTAYQHSESDDLQARPRFVTEDSEGNAVLRRRVDGTVGRYTRTQYYSASVLQGWTHGIFQHRILLGVDHERLVDGREAFIAGPDETADEALNIFNPVYGTLDPSLAVPSDTGRFRRDGDTTGIYLQDVVSLGSHWTALVGARYERYDSVQRTENVDGAVLTDGDALLPRVGVVYRPIDWVSLYASYSESFRPNSFTPENFDPDVSTDFDPEQGVSREIGVKLQRAGITATTAAFQIDKRNVLVVENMIPRLIDTAEVRGVELDVAGELLPRWSLQAAYTYMDSDDGSGRTITNVARHTVGATTSYRWIEGRLSGLAVGLSGQYVGDRNGGSNPSASPGGPEFFTVPSYTVVDLFTAYTFRVGGQALKAQLNLKNALDKDYFPSSGGSLRINPGQSRTLFLSIGAEL